MGTDALKIVVVSPNEAVREVMRSALRTAEQIETAALATAIVDLADFSIFDGVNLVVLDVDAHRRDHLLAMQKVMTHLAGQTPVIVLTEQFDEAVGRWFVQARVSDFLRKPLRPEDIRTSCLKILRANGDRGNGEIICFAPAAGGVGNTTLAIEAAMLIRKSSEKSGRSTCLVDLDFQSDACAGYLDIEPRLDFAEIGAMGERLDLQLLEVMCAHHESGLVLIAAPFRHRGLSSVDSQVIMRLLDIVSARFDNVIIDLPRFWTSWSNTVLAGSDRVFVVTDTTVPALRAARRMAQQFGEEIEGCTPRVIVNRFVKSFLFGGSLKKSDLERALSSSFAGVVSNNYTLVREAIDRGVPLQKVKKGNNVSADLERILFASAA